VNVRRDRLLASTTAIRAVLANRELGRVLASWLAANGGTYAFLVVTIVAAYTEGGALAAGLLGVVRYLPPTVVAPLAGIPTTRWRADRVLLAVNLGRTTSIFLTFVVMLAGGNLALLFLLVGIEAGFGGLTRPLHISLLPWLARTPGELVASNVASSAAEGLGTLIGPALAGLLLATAGVLGALVATGTLMALAALSIVSIHVPMIRTSVGTADLRAGLTAGVRIVARTPAVRIVIVDAWLQTLVRGMLTILLVVAAIDRLGMGEPGVGVLNAAVGAGGVLGAIVAISLTGRSQFSSTFALSLAMWGLPIAALGLATEPFLAIGLLVVVGLSNAILDVTAFTLLQRSAPNEGRVGVMGLLDSGAAASAAIGGVLASVLVAGFGIQVALLLTGAILPVAAVITLPALRRAESGATSHETQARLLHADPLLSPLSLSIVEELAAVLEPVEFADGEPLILEGEGGDRYLIVATGTVDVSQAGQWLRRLGPGSGVGEISLLRDTPRTATVQAVGPVTAYALDREPFLLAVTGHSAIRTAAEGIVTEHLGRTRSGA
jgi:predicted MFS family arabinose efflux permease